jgi:photosystem II stability/assembly factor-like uncharacterized protein
MKNFIFTFLFVVVCATGYSQKWLSEPWFTSRADAENEKPYNFYEIQKAFEAFEKEYWSQETERCEGEDKPKFKGYNGYKRWEWFNEPRVFPTGEFPSVELVLDEYEKFSKTKSEAAANAGTGKTNSAAWVNLVAPLSPGGPAAGIGRINCMAFLPGNTNTLFVGAACGGVWKSTDAGQSWNVLNTDQLPSLSITNIVIDPNNPNNIYLATGDNFTGFIITGVLKQGHYSAGIVKSTDAGQTWSVISMPSTQSQQFIPQQMIMDPTTPNVMLLASNTGIWRSVNNGVNWTLQHANFFYSIEFNPLNHMVVYATDAQGLWRSNDNGLTWVYRGGGYPNNGAQQRVTLAVTPADTNYIYLWGPTAGFKRSVNGGTTFAAVGNPDAIAQPYGYVDRALAVSQTNALEIYAGGMIAAKSINGGNTWAAASNFNNSLLPNWIHPDIKRLVYEPGGNKIYALNDGGISFSADGAASWQNISNGLQIAEVYKIANHPWSADTVLYGAQDNGTNRWDAQTASVNVLDLGDGFQPLFHPVNPQTVYVLAQLGALKKSVNGGASFISASPGQMLWNCPVKMNPLNPRTMYAACVGGVKKSVDSGTQGTYVNMTAAILTNIRSLAITRADTNYIYAATFSNIILSTDNGNTWTDITAGLPTNLAAISYIGVSSADPARVYVCLSGYSNGNKVYLSTNAGSTWSNYSGVNLPNVPVNCIEFVDGSNNQVYIGTDFGVFERNGAAADWSSFSTGLPNVVVNHLEVHYPSMKLRAGTYGRGVWETDLTNVLGIETRSPLTAEVVPGGVKLQWSTSSESNCARFEVERSGDGHQFSRIHSAEGHGNSSVFHAYETIDEAPDAGINFYRTRQIDFNGSYVLSNVVSVHYEQLVVTCYPNPTDGLLTIETSGASAGRIDILNMLGEVVFETHDANPSIDLSNQPRGMYFVRVSAGDQVTTQKIVLR